MSGEPHHQDDGCDGCQKERAENSKLVDFYERLDNMKNKIGKLKDVVTVHQRMRDRNEHNFGLIQQKLSQNPDQHIQLIKEHNSKEMGYQLASALIEREAKVKVENQKLKAVIASLLKEREHSREWKEHSREWKEQSDKQCLQNECFSKGRQSKLSDSLDEVRRTKDSETFNKSFNKSVKSNRLPDDTRNYWEDEAITKFSDFRGSQPTKKANQPDYSALNLWLYQYKSEEPEVFSQPKINHISQPINQPINAHTNPRLLRARR